MAESFEGLTMFGFFAITVYSLFLFPYTYFQFRNHNDDHYVPKGKKAKQQPSAFSMLFKRVLSKDNAKLLALWVVWLLLVRWVQHSAEQLEPFNPYKILGVPEGSSDREIKQAYRELSLRYHPDKNPDPAATQYFVETITKAHEMLTDPVKRANYELYGHPDGYQEEMSGVALPEWMLLKDERLAPLLLLVVMGGILVPIGYVSYVWLKA